MIKRINIVACKYFKCFIINNLKGGSNPPSRTIIQPQIYELPAIKTLFFHGLNCGSFAAEKVFRRDGVAGGCFSGILNELRRLNENLKTSRQPELRKMRKSAGSISRRWSHRQIPSHVLAEFSRHGGNFRRPQAAKYFRAAGVEFSRESWYFIGTDTIYRKKP